MPQLNVASWVECTEAEGPGKRFALWVQGCLKRCKGCCNPHMLEIVEKRIICCQECLHLIRSIRKHHGIEGVTFLGGEPFLQAKGLAYLAAQCQEMKLSVMAFTGYSLNELYGLNLPYTENLIRHTDVLVDGPFVQSLIEDSRNWVGSKNQKFHYLSNFYRPGIEYEKSYTRGMEIRVGRKGSLHMNGWPSSKLFVANSLSNGVHELDRSLYGIQ